MNSNRVYNVKITRRPFVGERSLRGTSELPEKVDLRHKCPPVYHQGSLGSCTAQALCAAHAVCDPDFIGSRLFLYYNERLLHNNTGEDTGASVEDGVRCMEKYGICTEMSYPYIIENFTKPPPPECYTDALLHQAVKVKQIEPTLLEMKKCLASGVPFVCGIGIYKSFEDPRVERTGVVDLPKEGERLLGGHAVLVVGYNDKAQRFLVRNSWGMFWGDSGHFSVPYEYLTSDKYCSDLWAILQVEEDPKDETRIARFMTCLFPFLQSCRTGLL